VIGVGVCLAITAILSLFLFPYVGMPFLAMRVVQGIGTSLVDSGLGRLVADVSPPAARAQVFAICTIWLNLAGALMPGLGEAIARRGGLLPLFGAAALAVAGGLVTLGRLPETWRPRQEEGRPVPSLLKGAAPLLLGGVVVGLAYSILTVFVPVARIAAAPGRAGLFFFAHFVGLIGVRLTGGLASHVAGATDCLVTCLRNGGRRSGRALPGGFVHRAGRGRSGLRGQPCRPDARPLRTPAVRHPAGPAVAVVVGAMASHVWGRR
jgi:MFS family permease